MDERVIAASTITPQDDPALRAARRLATEFSLLACERLREGDAKDASILAEWQRYMEQVADGVDVSAIALPAHRPARANAVQA